MLGCFICFIASLLERVPLLSRHVLSLHLMCLKSKPSQSLPVLITKLTDYNPNHSLNFVFSSRDAMLVQYILPGPLSACVRHKLEFCETAKRIKEGTGFTLHLSYTVF